MAAALTSQLRSTATHPDFEEAWHRQRNTARDILRRLEIQEGLILADQVGMGKTYVALAVAVSQILSTEEPGQVLVLAPAAVAQKWVDEWSKFSESLLKPHGGLRCVAEPLRSGEALLAALDDPPERRSHVLVASHTALTSTLKDTFIQLALLHIATRRRPDRVAERAAIARWSEGRGGLLRDSRFTAERVGRLLEVSPSTWRAEWERLTYESLPDDPVPQAVLNAMEGLDLGQLREIVASLPRRSSAGIDHRLKQARAQLNDATQEIWRAVLASTDLSLPLLIVDEAHRLKNDDTRISQLFAPRTPGHHSGALTNIFDRILLLTATPFELGHAELVRVLRRLNAVQGHTAPGLHNSLDERLDRLAEVLTNAQAAAINLDHAWSNVTAEDHHRFDEWTPGSAPAEGLSAHAATAWRAACYAATSRQQMHEALRPWVIRHERPRRRTYLPGRDILPSTTSGSGSGLDIADDVALPFLLAARAQAVAGEQAHGAARPHFAYGIASSFEAFRRLGSSDELRDSDVAADESTPTESKAGTSVSSSADWYHREIDVLLIDGGLDRHDHPKVKATVERAADLWLSGHKCLVFCWYIATGKAVELAIQARVESLIWERAAQALALPVGDAQAELTRVSERLLRRDSRSYDETRARLEKFFAECVARADQKPQQGLVDNLVEIAIRNLRTPANLVRYAPLSVSISHDELWAGVQGSNPVGIRLLDRWERFAMRLAADGPDEQERVILSLLGEHATEGSDGVSDVDSSRGGASLSAVRRAHGGTKRDTRERLTALFNTPFAPDVLVASSVMGEGIDLHRECRHVIHHDLDWNPSVLEQRTGRLDRIGALAEHDGDIEVYEPYLAGTHDEKMYKVVKDRAGWFDIVMGRAAGGDESGTDREETRVPLADSIARALTMNLQSR